MKTLGQHMVSNILPNYKDQIVNKSELNRLLLELAKISPAEFGDVVTKLKIIGDNVTTIEGITVGLDDLDIPNRSVIDQYVKKIKSIKDINERRRLIGLAWKDAVDIAKTLKGNFGLMVGSGGRGNYNQLSNTAVAAMGVMGNDKEIYPWIIKNSYSTGLTPSEYWVSSIAAHRNVVESRLSVSEPGEMGRLLSNTMIDKLITESDCGTSNGIFLQINDENIVDRFIAVPVRTFKRNTLITPEILLRLKKVLGNSSSVRVRSPMTCETHDGICQYCYGLDTSGKLLPIGTNIGVKAAQAMGEPLTQIALNAKHGGRKLSNSTVNLEGISGIKQMIEIPQTFKNKAVLSGNSGKVTAVKDAPQGGKYIYVEDQPYYIQVGLKSLVKKGDSINKGTQLSDGVVKTDELVQYKGLGEGRKYLLNTLNTLYKNEGINLDRRHLETAVKSIVNFVQINEADHKKGLLPGDIIDYNKFMSLYKKSVRKIQLNSLKEFNDSLLGENIFEYTAGTPLTEEVIKDLKSKGIKEINIFEGTPEFSSIARPVSQVPLLNPNWLAKMSHRNLRKTLLKGVREGQETELEGTHPIPGYFYGRDFGKNETKY